jgi:hypothetical protein
MTLHREGAKRPARIDLTKILAAASDRHVEIMRDDLSELYFDAGRDDVEYVFGDTAVWRTGRHGVSRRHGLD